MARHQGQHRSCGSKVKSIERGEVSLYPQLRHARQHSLQARSGRKAGGTKCTQGGIRATRCWSYPSSIRRAAFFDGCLDSLLAFSDPEDKILLIDDGSTVLAATSKERIDRLTKRAGVTARQRCAKNAGIAATRNKAMEWAFEHDCAFVDIPRRGLLHRESGSSEEHILTASSEWPGCSLHRGLDRRRQ